MPYNRKTIIYFRFSVSHMRRPMCIGMDIAFFIISLFIRYSRKYYHKYTFLSTQTANFPEFCMEICIFTIHIQTIRERSHCQSDLLCLHHTANPFSIHKLQLPYFPAYIHHLSRTPHEPCRIRYRVLPFHP